MKLVQFGLGVGAWIILNAQPMPVVALEGSGAAWGARDPAGCPSLSQTEPPSRKQAVALLRCTHEVAYDASGELWLLENVDVQIGEPVPFEEMYFEYVLTDADIFAATYPLSGSFTRTVCITQHDAGISGVDPSLNCSEFDVAEAKGVCWFTSFADWRCLMTGPVTETRKPTAPPQ